jgi:hypothetical protein
MFIRRLDLGLDADLDVAVHVLMQSTGYLLESYGLLPTTEICTGLARAYPANCAQTDRLAFAAFVKDEPVAFAQVACHWPTQNQASILLLCVNEFAHHQHLGCEFVDRLSKKARQWDGITGWYLSALEDSRRARAFWGHCGFCSVAVGVNARGHAGTMVNMRRPIKGRPVCQAGKVRDDPKQILAKQLVTRLV